MVDKIASLWYKTCMKKSEQKEKHEKLPEEPQEEAREPAVDLSEDGDGISDGIPHADELTRLNRIRGQIAGIRRMIEKGRDSMDILIQLKAARAAIKRIETRILRRHMRNCLDAAFGDSREEAERMMEELRNYFETY